MILLVSISFILAAPPVGEISLCKYNSDCGYDNCVAGRCRCPEQSIGNSDDDCICKKKVLTSIKSHLFRVKRGMEIRGDPSAAEFRLEVCNRRKK